MLAMTNCGRWILVLITGSAIGSILAVTNSSESTKASPETSRWILSPDDKNVPGVEPLNADALFSGSESSKEKIPVTTIRHDVSEHDFIPQSNSKSIEIIPSTVVPKDDDAGQISSENVGKINFVNRSTSSEGRALNGNDVTVVVDEKSTNSLHGNITDLSDVSMDDDDKEIEGGEYVASKNMSGMNVIPPEIAAVAVKMCIYGNQTYSPGMEVRRDCEDRCVCGDDGNLADCRPLCVTPFIRAGRGIQDSLCQEKLIPNDPCCATVVCAEDSEPEPEESCYLGNKTILRGETIEDGCSRVCICEAQGHLKCRPRCPSSNSTSMNMATTSDNHRDKCVPLTDPNDSCCTITLCDVTLDDFDLFKPEHLPAEAHVNVTKVEALNSTAVQLQFSKNLIQEHVTIELSTDNLLWREERLGKDGIIGGLKPSHTYYVRVAEATDGRPGTSLRVTLPADSIEVPMSKPDPMIGSRGNNTGLSTNGCKHRGKSYKVGEEWYDECISFCSCSMVGNTPQTECATIECPTDFGLDVLDPHCLDWEWVPADFVPIPPRCCSQEVRCKNNGSCLYEGEMYNNWSEIPSNVTGCEKRCYCELGNVSCQPACPPVTALPPANLQCPPSHASLKHLPEDECCLHWVCGHPSNAAFPPNIGPDFDPRPGFPGQGPASSSDQVTVQTLEAVAEDRVRLVFTVPRILVGLHGRVEVRYTSEKTNFDPATWKSQTFAPPDDLIATSQLEFELGGLTPATEYKVMVKVTLRDLANSPTSKIYSVVTLEAAMTDVVTLPPQIPTDPELNVAEANSTWANIVWKKFTEYELQFIDGVQLRYKETEGKVYAATPLIHRAVTSYVIENLKPAMTYEVGIYFIPFPGQSTELISEKAINFTTSTEPDPYSFDIKVEIKGIKSTEVEVAWKGVPYPEDKYVNIYRAIYQSDTGKEDTSTFKIAKRDSPARTIIGDLKPGTRYRLWIEVYLTNGRIKKSNVQDFVTKPGVPSSAGVLQQGKLASQVPLHEGDYYGPLVIVAIVASLAILSTLILLMMLMKRRTSSKADISPRKTTSAYDNPSYKVEIQQETMDL